MRIALISDTHGNLPSIPEDVDAVIHAGDICPDAPTGGRTQEEWLASTFAEWCATSAVPIYATWGNHDFTQRLTRAWEDNLRPSVYIIVDAWVPITGRKVWFSPWVPNLPMWAWNLSERALATKASNIPDDIDIIVSHGPPYGCGDALYDTGHNRVGSHALRHRIGQLPNLTHVICGHIHEDRGTHIIHDDHDITVLNVASVDGNYDPYTPRWTFLELEDKT